MSEATIVISNDLYWQIEAEGAAAYPNECCGAILGRDAQANGITRRTVERLLPMSNAFESAEQFHRFSISPKQLMDAEKIAGDEGRLVLGFYHSHPDHPARPSQYDLDHAWPFYSYVIVAIEKRQPRLMTCWGLDENADSSKFVEQKIEKM